MSKGSKSKLAELGELTQRSLKFLQDAIRTHEEPKNLPEKMLLDPDTFPEYLEGIWETWATAALLEGKLIAGKFAKQYQQIEEAMGDRCQVVQPTDAITHHAAVCSVLHEFLGIAVQAGRYDDGVFRCPAWVFELELIDQRWRPHALRDDASDLLNYRYYTRLSARVDSMARFPLEDWEPPLRVEIAAATGSRSKTPPTWERITIDPDAGYATLDGQKFKIGQGRPAWFLQALIDRKGEPIRNKDVSTKHKEGEKAARLYKRLPPEVQALIHSPKTDGKPGYWLLP